MWRWIVRVGVGYRREMRPWIQTNPRGVDCLEITAEHFVGHERPLSELRKNYRLFVHGLGLSLGTPGKLDSKRLTQFVQVVRAADPEWVSEHVAFTRTPEIDLGHLNPIPPTRGALRVIAEHAREVAERCEKPILLENVTSYVRLEGELSETDFLNELCEQANCGLLLDVTNLFINSRNHGFDPVAWLHELEPKRIQQLHIVGYAREGNRYTDTHSAPVQEELVELAKEVVSYAPVDSVILERDEDIPQIAELEAEVVKLERIIGRH